MKAMLSPDRLLQGDCGPMRRMDSAQPIRAELGLKVEQKRHNKNKTYNLFWLQINKI